MLGLTAALDELYATGWTTLDGIGCPRHHDGRAYPSTDRVRSEFELAGVTLDLRRVDAFGCVRATWHDRASDEGCSAVGASEAEAAVYALARFRRQQADAAVAV